MRRLAIALTFTLCIAASAHAEDDGQGKRSEQNEASDVLSNLDRTFDQYVVQPFAAVLFFDVVFWDDGDHALKQRCLDAGLDSSRCDELVAQTAPSGKARKEKRLNYCETTGRSRAECKDLLSGIELPIIVLWLLAGHIFFTLRFTFINLRAFGHGLAVTLGRYDNPDDPGEVSHFQALSSALSATVGLGNIAGVAVAVGMGGPGAVLWMIVAGFLGMSTKFTECTLAQLYREVDAQGRVSGGPMRYLQKGLSDFGPQMKPLGKVLAVLFAVMCIGTSFGAGNMFQANQSYAQMSEVVPALQGSSGQIGYGLVLALLVGIVIIGGIRRIGTVTSYIVPFMCALYLLAGLFIVLINFDEIPAAFGFIWEEAFTPKAGFGGFAGVLVQGIRRGVFSNEAGIGSAAIAHSAAATDEPVREGVVALLEPFIDTLIVCTMTALVVVITGAYREPGEGIVMTSNAFGTVLPWFPNVLSIAVVLFAFSTMISWSYYGERCWSYLFGPKASMLYRSLFLVFIVLGCVLQLGSVVEFADLMILGMALPNVLGLILLSGKVKQALDRYWASYKSGSMLTRTQREAKR
jgi:AGCS family alanine or glycine:cation symporter